MSKKPMACKTDVLQKYCYHDIFSTVGDDLPQDIFSQSVKTIVCDHRQTHFWQDDSLSLGLKGRHEGHMYKEEKKSS
jgi:hypothetical protein